MAASPLLPYATAGALVLLFLGTLYPSALILTAIVLFFALRARVASRRPSPPKRRIGLFHPFTNDGGGGERVLWCIVKALQELPASQDPSSLQEFEWVVYSGDAATPESLAERARKLFGLQLHHSLKVVPLVCRPLAEASSWPHLTLFGQSLGSVVLAAEALLRCPPSLFIDTSGHAFAYPMVKLLLPGCPVACYTHYPTISTDMVQRVRNRASLYNNSDLVAKSSVLSGLKLYYYRAFAVLYGLAGYCADVAMVNSSWTEDHIRHLWRWTKPGRILRVYPPCDTTALQKFPLEKPEDGQRFIISVAQFRPEKNHALQLRAFALALEAEAKGKQVEPEAEVPAGAAKSEDRAGSRESSQQGSSTGAQGPQGTDKAQDKDKGKEKGQKEASAGPVKAKSSWAATAMNLLSFKGGPQQKKGAQGEVARKHLLEGVRLKLVGGSRNKADEQRIDMLASLAEQLGVSGKVDFCVNVPFCELQVLLGGATCGLHTMLDEHFGISIVEYMAAGAIAIAHNSGGPCADILKPEETQEGRLLPVGFLAVTAEEYADSIREVFKMLPEERLAMAERARIRAASYSEEKFVSAVQHALGPFLGGLL